MKNYFKYLGVTVIIVLSFYYTEQVASIVLNKNPLMIKINEEKKNYEVKSVNAEIEGDYIIPGINGLKINAKDSYYKMQELETFNKYYLVYEQVKPEITLSHNKDKIIKKGNERLNKVSLIIEKESLVSDYLKSYNIKASLLTTMDSYTNKSYFELINNDLDNFKALEKNLSLNKQNKNICVLNYDLKDICIKNHNYLVEPTLVFNDNNLIDIKKELTGGSIILIKDNVKLDNLKLLIKEINFKDLEMVYLSEIITEENKNY